MGKYLYHPATIGLATLITLAFFFSTNSSLKNYQNSSNNIKTLENQNTILETEVAQLEKEKLFSESDFAKEKIIRDELLLQKPGEYVIQLPESFAVIPSPSPSPSPKPIEEWKKILLD